ncbi:DUF4476 domain-containing protein [Flavobacterium sp. CYK-4]|uniref:DUF4476 domain-containing protein n=1 Tax=Flavobacterium lotistagni TaxID=2709660 RepID=UPI00140DB22D|nr:DUF4476 domain-containing protein [Flavobacterium lotistagni]NHM06651.1 DUF4476 domain-containing protein [Flavobacterium lotistagni]
MRLRITLTLLFVSFLSFGQQSVGHLTIFSEDGDKFFLILNGEKINDTPQTNLRVEDLNQPYYNAKVIFADAGLEAVSKNNLMLTDVDGVFSDVTYKIKRDKNKAGKMKMNYFSSIPVTPNFVPASNVHVIHYGQPVQQVVVQQPQTTGTVHQTTTTTTTSGTGTGVNAGINVNGVGVGINLNINDGMAGTVTQTTTTTTSSSSSSSHTNHSEPEPVSCRGKMAMSGANFSKALETLKNQGFDDSRLKTAKQISQSNCLSTQQITEICNTFGFEENKLAFAKFAYDGCTDPKNYYNINNIFAFSSSSDELNDYVSSRQ